MNPLIPTIDVLGLRVASASVESLAEIERLYREAVPALVTYVNAHSLNLAGRDAEYRSLLQERFLVFKDGVGVGIAARMLGAKFPENITFTDFSPLVLCLAAERKWRVFFLGGEAGVAETAARRLTREIPGLDVAGSRDGFTVWHSSAEAIAGIRAARTDLLVVAMGNPVQEKWLAEHLGETGARMGLAVGGYLDFAAGHRKRAPVWWQRLRIEWIHRLLCEPRRMWRRYVVGNPEFLLRVVLYRLRRGRNGALRG